MQNTFFPPWLLSLALYLMLGFAVRSHFLHMDHTAGCHPILLFNMGIDILDHGLDKLCRIRLLESLVHMNNILYYFCMKNYGTLHTILKFKELIMLQFLPSKIIDTLVCHVLHVHLSIEIVLRNQFLHCFLCLSPELVPPATGAFILGVGWGSFQFHSPSFCIIVVGLSSCCLLPFAWVSNSMGSAGGANFDADWFCVLSLVWWSWLESQNSMVGVPLNLARLASFFHVSTDTFVLGLFNCTFSKKSLYLQWYWVETNLLLRLSTRFTFMYDMN